MKVAVTRSGIMLRVLFPFRFGNPNLYIPWQEVKLIAIKNATCEKGISGIISGAFDKLSRNMYAHISLSRHSDKIIIPWEEMMKSFVPASTQFKNEL